MIQSVCNKNESCGDGDYSLGSVEFSPQKFIIRETSQPWSSDPSDMSFWTHSANSVVTRVSHVDRTIRADCYPGRRTEMWLLSLTILIILLEQKVQNELRSKHTNRGKVSDRHKCNSRGSRVCLTRKCSSPCLDAWMSEQIRRCNACRIKARKKQSKPSGWQLSSWARLTGTGKNIEANSNLTNKYWRTRCAMHATRSDL